MPLILELRQLRLMLKLGLCPAKVILLSALNLASPLMYVDLSYCIVL